MIIGIDWDGTLVDAAGNWLPGAQMALLHLQRGGHTLFIHSSRANSAFGQQQIKDALGVRFGKLAVVPKAGADLYIDNQALRFVGDWAATLREVRRHAKT